MDRETGNLSERLVYRVYRGQTTIIALGLIFLGTVSLVFVNSTLPEDTLWYHLIRDISIVALISGFITTLYEYLIRDQFFYQLRTTQIDQVERLQSLLQQEFDRQRKYFPRIIDEVPYEVQKAVRT